MPNSNGLLIIAVKVKDKKTSTRLHGATTQKTAILDKNLFHTAAMLLFYILQKIDLNKVHIFLTTYYRT
jgi:hypothetical protein